MGRTTIVQGSPLPLVVRVVSGLVAIVSAISVVGLPLSVACIAVITYTGGTEIDPERNRLREFSSTLGSRWGKWRSLDIYAAIVILRVRRVRSTHSRSNLSVDQEEINHDVTLVDGTHRKKFLVKACDTLEEARTIADRIAQRTGMPIERYAPVPITARRR